MSNDYFKYNGRRVYYDGERVLAIGCATSLLRADIGLIRDGSTSAGQNNELFKGVYN